MARLTIPDEESVASFDVTSSEDTFPISFSLFVKEDLRVSIDGVSLGSAYWTFSGSILDNGGYDGGTITLNTAVANSTVLIWRDTVTARATNFVPQTSVSVGSLDAALNREMAILQEHKRDIRRSIKLQPDEVATDAAPASERRGNVLVWEDTASAPLGHRTAAQLQATLVKGDPGGNTHAIGLFTAIGAQTVPVGTDTVISSGFDTLGKGIAIYKRLGAGPYTTKSYRKADLAGQYFEYVPQSWGSDAMAFGVKADGVTDDWDALTEAIGFLSVNPLGTYYTGGGRIFLPAGWMILSDTLVLKTSTVAIQGQGTGQFGGFSTIMEWPGGIPGISIEGYNTLGGVVESPPTTASNTSLISNVALFGGGGVVATAHAIRARTRFAAEHVYIDNWGGDGFNVECTSGSGDPETEGNGNNWYIAHCRAERCRNGAKFSGGDSNAGTSISFDVSNNRLWGIDDESFLGNTHIGAHAATNVSGPFKSTNANARNAFINCYSEAGQGTGSLLMKPAMVIHGEHGSGFDPASTAYMVWEGGFLAPAGTDVAPSRSWAEDSDTGWFSYGTGIERFSSNGAVRQQISNVFKATTDGTFVNATLDTHEFVQNHATRTTLHTYNKSTSFSGSALFNKVETAAGTGWNHLLFQNSTVSCFAVLGNGNAQNANNSYGAISDRKLKRDIEPAGSAWDAFKAYEFVKFRFKNDPKGPLMLGLIAQDVEAVSPGLIEETPDFEDVWSDERVPDDENPGEMKNIRVLKRSPLGTVTKGVKYSVLALQAHRVTQEGQARIESLEASLAAALARIDALEAA